MKTSSLSSITAPIGHLLRRYHIIMFSVFVLGGLAILIFLLSNSIASSTNPLTQKQPSSGAFNKQTMDRLETLRPSSDTESVLEFPYPRKNPFVE